jgi:hypothetical protein
VRDAVDKIDAAWKAWLVALDRVDPTRREEEGVCGYWSVKDLIAHLALCDRVVAEHIQRWQLGLPRYMHAVDAENQANYLATHDRDYDLLRIEMHAAHQLARQAILAIEGEPDDDIRERIAAETWDHYPEHTRQVADWLAGRDAR